MTSVGSPRLTVRDNTEVTVSSSPDPTGTVSQTPTPRRETGSRRGLTRTHVSPTTSRSSCSTDPATPASDRTSRPREHPGRSPENLQEGKTFGGNGGARLHRDETYQTKNDDTDGSPGRGVGEVSSIDHAPLRKRDRTKGSTRSLGSDDGRVVPRVQCGGSCTPSGRRPNLQLPPSGP